MARSPRRGAKRGKYGVRSKFENTVLTALVSRGVSVEYEADVLTYSSTVRSAECADCGSENVVQNRKYTPDFKITRSNKSVLYIEAKGFFKSEDRSKMRSVLKSNPTADIRMLFMRNGKIAGSELRYSEWCEKYGIQYHIGWEVPESWLL